MCVKFVVVFVLRVLSVFSFLPVQIEQIFKFYRVFRNVDTMDLFMLPRDIRCRLISLLLGAVKIERDQHIVSGAIRFDL